MVPCLEIKCHCGWHSCTLCGYGHDVNSDCPPSLYFHSWQDWYPMAALWYRENDLCICSTAQKTSSILVSTVAGKWSCRHNAQSGPDSQGLAPKTDRVMGLGSPVNVVQIIKDKWVQSVISHWERSRWSITVLTSLIFNHGVLILWCIKVRVSNLLLSCGVLTEVQKPYPDMFFIGSWEELFSGESTAACFDLGKECVICEPFWTAAFCS